MSEVRITGYSKIMSHPDRDEIVEKLIGGDSVRVIEDWLKRKYPTNKSNQISFVSLQSYRKNFLKLENDAIKNLQKERKTLEITKRQEQDQEKVQKLQAYQVGLANYVQNNIIDYNAEILDLMNECKEGMRHLKALNESKGSHLNHIAISAYIARLQDVVQMHSKFISSQEKKDSNKIHEDYEQLNRKMEILVESVREAFNQTNPEGLYLFLDLVKNKLRDAGIA
jgi:hypothetical protein